MCPFIFKKYRYKNDRIYKYSKIKNEAEKTKKVKRTINHAVHDSLVWENADDIQDDEKENVEEHIVNRVVIEFNNYLIAAFTIDISFEFADIIPSIIPEKCIIHNGYDQRQVKVSKAESRETKTILRRNPKYFCLSCTTDLCKDCFNSACISHNVLWVGNRLFRCSSPYHVENQ